MSPSAQCFPACGRVKEVRQSGESFLQRFLSPARFDLRTGCTQKGEFKSACCVLSSVFRNFEETLTRTCMAPVLCGSEVVSIDQLDARVLRVRRAFRQSKHAIAAARDDLENHQLWLDRHRAAWAEHVKHYERRLGSKRGIWAVKRLGLRLFLVFPLVCVALFRLVARFVPHLRGLRRVSFLPLHTLANLIQKRVWSLLSSWPGATRHTEPSRSDSRPRWTTVHWATNVLKRYPQTRTRTFAGEARRRISWSGHRRLPCGSDYPR